MLRSRPCTLNCWTNLSYNRSLRYRLRTDHTENTSHVIAISPVHWRADCCLATSYNIRPIVACPYRGAFIEPLPSNALRKSGTICCIRDHKKYKFLYRHIKLFERNKVLMLHDSINNKNAFYLKYSKYGAFTLTDTLLSMWTAVMLSIMFAGNN
jgi:hypothetical protein